MQVLYLLLTRFNLRKDAFGRDKRRNETLSPAWYEERFRLFDGICYPSVRGQSSRDFIWHVFFDSTTPAIYRDRIAGYACESPRIRIEWLDGMAEYAARRRALIDGYLAADPNCRLLVTSRLDNDDGLHRDFVATVLGHARGVTTPTIVDFPRGYLLEKRADLDLIRATTDRFGAFLSLAEPVEAYRTVSHFKHRQWKDEWKAGRVRLVRDDCQPMWLQTIHARNLKNRMKHQTFLQPKEVLEPFGVNPAGLRTDYGLAFRLIDGLRVIVSRIGILRRLLRLLGAGAE
jgi:hypothetical protein